MNCTRELADKQDALFEAAYEYCLYRSTNVSPLLTRCFPKETESRLFEELMDSFYALDQYMKKKKID